MTSDRPQDDPGGLGGEAEYPHREKYAHRIIARLYKRQEWQIPQDCWFELPEMLFTVAKSSDSDRERISAARTLVAMSQTNQQGTGVDARVNAQLGQVIDVPPESPEDVDLEQQEAFYEVVSPESQKEQLRLMEELGLLDRYIGQIEHNHPLSPSKNGNGKPSDNGS